MKTTRHAGTQGAIQPLDTGLRRREECGTGSTPVELIPRWCAPQAVAGRGPAGRGAL